MTTAHRWQLAQAAAALALTLAVGGCSNTQAIGRDGTLHLALTEYRIQPQSVRAHAGRLTIVVRNYGRRTHNLVLSLNGHTVGSTVSLWPGQSSNLTLTLAAGHYLMSSTLLSDQALGEYGTLLVSPH